MYKYNYLSKSNDDTLNLGRLLAKYLKNKDIIILSGELGAGKTKLTEGILSFFDLQDEISSPTFTIVNEYIRNDINIYHFDAYRLSDSSEFYEIGGEEYFEKGICIIEWGELILDAIPEEHLEIKFEKNNKSENSRSILFKAYGKKYEIILDNLKEELLWKYYALIHLANYVVSQY